MKIYQTLLLIGTLPFIASCASWNTAEISVGLEHGDLTYQAAKEAIADGADVKNGWTNKPFIQRAVELGRKDLVILFLENGASPFDAPGGYKAKPFSLFEFVVGEKENSRKTEKSDNLRKDIELLRLCLKYKDAHPEPMKTQLSNALPRLKEELIASLVSGDDERSDFAESAINEILSSQILPSDQTAEFSTEKIREELRGKATKALFTIAKYGARQNLPWLLGIDSSRVSRREFEEANLIDICIRLGADVNAKNKNGNSVLWVVLNSGVFFQEGADALLNAGAKLTPEETEQLTIATITNAGNARATIKNLYGTQSSAEAIKKLTEGVRIPQEKLNDALFQAVANNDGDGVRMCIEIGADVNAKNENGNSVLWVSLNSGVFFQDGADALLNAGATLTPEETEQLTIATITNSGNARATIKNLYGTQSSAEAIKKLTEGVQIPQEKLNDALFQAVANNDGDGVRMCIEIGADVNAKNKNGNSVLWRAMSKNKETSIAILKAAHAEITPAETEELKRLEELERKRAELEAEKAKQAATEELFAFLKNNNYDEQKPLEFLDKGADITAKDKDGQTTLYCFLLRDSDDSKKPYSYLGMSVPIEYKSDSEFIKRFKSAGGRMTEDEEIWMLFLYIADNKWESVKNLIADSKARLGPRNIEDYKKRLVARTDRKGRNAFHAFALSNGGEDLVKFLVEEGVDINKKTDNGWSPLGIAIYEGNTNAVRLLLKYGADPNTTVTIEGEFGSIEKKLMTFAIEEHNRLIDERRSGQLNSNVRVLRASEIVSLMSKATGTEVTDL